MHRQFGFSFAPAALLAAGVFVGPVVGAEATNKGVQDDQADRIDKIVVVAHKDQRSTREIAANVTVLSRADLNDTLATTVNDVFRYVPGVDYEAAGNRFATEGINIRGIGGNRVAIIVDGVPLSDHFSVGSSSLAAVSGYASITVPAGSVFGLPIGVSFIGGPFSEQRLIQIAYAFEQATRARRAPLLSTDSD